jgi:hypothetical protein
MQRSPRWITAHECAHDEATGLGGHCCRRVVVNRRLALWLAHEAYVRRPALADDDGSPARRTAHPLLVRPAVDRAWRVFIRPGRTDAAGWIGKRHERRVRSLLPPVQAPL